jgi:nicotinamidase/pyrazinamidase
MSTIFRRKGCDRVLIDLNTQCDYLLPRGSVPVANRTQIIPNIRRLFEWARHWAVPVISSLDAHRADEPFGGLPRHCVDRTPGQRKLPFTLLPRRILLDGDNTLDLPADIIARYRQIIFAKRSRDLLGNPKADRLLSEVTVTHQIVFGVVSEHCVKATVLALLTRQRNVVVVRDACGHWNGNDAELALRQIEAKGAYLATTDQITAFEPLPVRVFPVPVADESGGEPLVPAHAGGNGAGNGHGRRGEHRMAAAARAARPTGRLLA